VVSEVTSNWQQLLQDGKQAFTDKDPVKARNAFEAALEQAYKNDAPEAAVAEIFFQLGLCLHYLQDFTNAEKRYKQALATVERAEGPGSSHSVAVMKQMVILYGQGGKTEEADQMRQRLNAMPNRSAQNLTPSMPPHLTGSQANWPAASAQAPQGPTLPADLYKDLADLTKDPADLTKNSADLTKNSADLTKDSADLTKNSADLTKDSADLTKNSADLTKNSADLTKNSAPSTKSPVLEPPKVSSTHSVYKTKRERAQSQGQAPKIDVLADYEQRTAASAQRAKDEHIDVLDLVHPREKLYGSVSFAFGCLVYGLSFLFLIGLAIAPLMVLSSFIITGIHYGALRSRGIRVSPDQFPEVYDFVEKYCTLMNMEVPEVFVIQEHGLLNAFAQRLHRRNLLTICSDVLELAYEQGDRELAFVVVHELTHIKRGHVKWGWLHMPANMIPFFGNAYSRACEYTCDRVAAYLVPDGALYGLVCLASGKALYKRVNLQALYEQQEKDWDFWTWYHEITSTHPNLLNRIRAIGIADEVAQTSFARR